MDYLKSVRHLSQGESNNECEILECEIRNKNKAWYFVFHTNTKLLQLY
jgi:hypothetical protein